MTISGFNIFVYELPLRQPLHLGDHVLNRRTGFLIRLTNEQGQVGWGESAPLPGFSRESLDEAREQLVRLRFSLKQAAVPLHLEELSGGFDRWLTTFKPAPSVRFGIETAVLNLLAAERKVHLAGLIADSPADEVAINGLIVDSADCIARARKLADRGYGAVKMKVGRESIETDTVRVKSVREVLPDNIRLRLDANRAWSYDDAMRFAQATAQYHIEYIEEPLADSTRLIDFASHSPVPVALDETLCESTPDTIELSEGIAALIIKPSLLGGLETGMRYARRAAQSGLGIVVSSSFESSVGISALTHFAASMNRPDTAHGLDTSGWFSEDITEPSAETTNGIVRLPDLPTVAHIRTDLLREISYD